MWFTQTQAVYNHTGVERNRMKHGEWGISSPGKISTSAASQKLPKMNWKYPKQKVESFFFQAFALETFTIVHTHYWFVVWKQSQFDIRSTASATFMSMPLSKTVLFCHGWLSTLLHIQLLSSVCVCIYRITYIFESLSWAEVNRKCGLVYYTSCIYKQYFISISNYYAAFWIHCLLRRLSV